MSKNAFVTRLHTEGSDTRRERQVIEDLTNDQFTALEKNNLVREATAAEVKAASSNDGFVPATKEASAPQNKAAQTSSNKAS